MRSRWRSCTGRRREAQPTLGLTTAYRAVDRWREEGFVEEAGTRGGEATYVFCTAAGHHHHVVCVDCGATATLEGCALEPVRTAVEAAGFELADEALGSLPHGAPRARPMDAELALRTRGLSVDLGERRVLDDVTLDVPRGAVVGLVGPNGAGKTTLLRAIVGMLPVASGTIELGGTASYMPQLGPGAWDFPLDALEVALQGSYRRAGWLRRPSRTERGRAMDALAGVGMDGLARRQVGELSGGQRQRVLLARALMQDASLVLLDEPLSGADAATEASVHRDPRPAARAGAQRDHLHARSVLDRRALRPAVPAGRARLRVRAAAGDAQRGVPGRRLRGVGARRRRRPHPRARGAPRALMHYLTDPLQFEFMQRALVAVLLTGVASGVLGSYVVLRGLAFIGDALTHAVFPGIVIAFAAGRSILLGALIVGLITALGIAVISRGRRVSEDTAIGILFAGMFALGVVLVSSLATYQKDVAELLFGNILGVSASDLAMAGAATLVVVGAVFLDPLGDARPRVAADDDPAARTRRCSCRRCFFR